LLSMMVLETWGINGVMYAINDGSSGGGSTKNASVLKVIRMVRMLRISRMARLLRSIPELVVLIKGIKAASRSVVVFFLLWFLIIYVFAVVFRQMTSGNDVGAKYFESVPAAMQSLLLDGILPGYADYVNELTEEDALLFPISMIFITLAAVTIMYMLIGVLVDVVAVIATTEKEGMTIASVAAELRHMFSVMGRDSLAPITQFEFRSLLTQPQFTAIVQDVNVDVMMLFEMSEVIFEDPEAMATGLSFEKFVEVILGMRGSNTATVRDVKEQYKAIKKLMETTTDQLRTIMSSQLGQLQNQIVSALDEVAEELHGEEGEEAPAADGDKKRSSLSLRASRASKHASKHH